MAPTLLALAGLPRENMQGADLARVALGETTDGPDAVLLQIFVPFNPDQVANLAYRHRQTHLCDSSMGRGAFDHNQDPADAQPARRSRVSRAARSLMRSSPL